MNDYFFLKMTSPFEQKLTDDGSYTFFSPLFNELFHSHFGAKQESEKKFVEPCQLLEKAKNKLSVTILDICYGLGYNTAAALSAIWLINPQCQVRIIALESDIHVPLQAIEQGLLNLWEEPIPQYLEQLTLDKKVNTGTLIGHLYINDARESIQFIRQHQIKADAIFLDPFSPPKCPELWTIEFMKCLKDCLKEDGYLATYSSSASVRNALQIVGLKIGSTPAVGRRSPGTIASFKINYLPPLSLQEQEHLNTRAGVPYRDFTLKDPRDIIINRRREEQLLSSLESSSQWKKRWLNLS